MQFDTSEYLEYLNNQNFGSNILYLEQTESTNDEIWDKIKEQLFLEGAREAGLMITDELLRQEIRNDRQFKSTNGQFDRNIFFQEINRAGYNEDSYSELYRKELLQKQLLSAIEFGISAPAYLVENIYRYRREQRVAKLIRIDHTSFKDIPDPTPIELANYHKNNAVTFTTPEYRSLTLLRLRPKDVADEIADEIGERAIAVPALG